MLSLPLPIAQLSTNSKYVGVVVDKDVRSPLGVGSCLLHVDGSYLSISREDLFNFLLGRQLTIHAEGHEEGSAILISTIITWHIANDLGPLIEVGELHLQFMPLHLKLALLRLVVSPGRAADQLETDEGISLLRGLIRRYYFNLFNLSINEEVRIKLLLSNMLWKIPYPELPNTLRSAAASWFLLRLGRVLNNNDIIPTITLPGPSVSRVISREFVIRRVIAQVVISPLFTMALVR